MCIRDSYILSLSSDHGVAPFPELVNQPESIGRRISKQEFKDDIEAIDETIQQKFNLEKSCIKAASGYRGIEPNFEVIKNISIDSLTLTQEIQNQLKNLDYVQETISFIDIKDKLCTKIFIEKTRNSFHPNHGYFIKIIGEKNYLISYKSFGTTHGLSLIHI